MNLIKPHLQNQNISVICRYALLTLLSTLCPEFSPDAQNNYDEIIVGFIIQNMSHSEFKIQHRSVQCLVNFARDLTDNEESKVDFKKYSD